MLKLTASFGKKLPVEGMDFSSQSYHASVEVEIPDGLGSEELDRRIHDTFDLVRGSVEAELTSGPRPNGFQGAPTGGQDFRAEPKRKAQPASAKQLAYLRDIAARRGMTLRELDDQAVVQCRVDTIDRLSREGASHLIDFLGGASAPRQRGQAA
jgi:hypothetical protein